MSLLPQGPLLMPGLSVTALCVPAREVGGDYYDFLPLGDQRVGVLIADVSGKGTSAALYMAELKGLVLSLSEIHSSPRDLLIAANRIIAHHLDARSFITMTYAVHRPARPDDDLRARRTHAAHLRARRLCRRLGARGADSGARRDGRRPEARQRRDVRAAPRRGDHRAAARRSLSALHRRHQRGDERARRSVRRERGWASWSRRTPTCRPRSCASGCCARSRPLSATRRSTTT